MKLSSKGKQLVEHALTERAWTLEKLAEESGLSIATIKKFSARKDVRRTTFVSLCKIFEIDWEVASGQATASVEEVEDEQLTSLQPSEVSTATHLDPIEMNQIRECCRQKILEQHSRMRLLSGDEIGVDQLYVDVWLLGKPEHKHLDSSESLLNSFDIEKDRLALSKRIQRNPGFDIANQKPKLIILGKPGSGKTTFLKHLAVDWSKSEFQPEKIAVLIELRRIHSNEWNLLSAVDRELGLDNWHQFNALEKEINNLKNQLLQEKGRLKKANLREEIEDLESQLKNLTLSCLLEQGHRTLFCINRT